MSCLGNVLWFISAVSVAVNNKKAGIFHRKKIPAIFINTECRRWELNPHVR